MTFDFTALFIEAKGETERFAAELFAEELKIRTGLDFPINSSAVAVPTVAFSLCDEKDLPNKDSYMIKLEGGRLEISAYGIRGLIYGFSYFLRKTEYNTPHITLIRDISGKYIPDKPIRGHQMGYRTTPNTFDAWDIKDYYRAYRDIMFFGCNIFEHIPREGDYRSNVLMKHDPNDLIVETSALADKLDLDISLWYPNEDNSLDEALKNREELFRRMPRLNVVFPPGGDPGEMEAPDFLERCSEISKLLKKCHPEARMWPSAQQPHSLPHWGTELIEELEKLPEGIDGIITGPNHAFKIDELRRRLPSKYPIRFYADITHNVRCEHPVHCFRDDWHYAWASCISRETVNPRPAEYRMLHKRVAPYVVGNVSYSEGAHDDVNKAVWSDLDFFPDVSLRETLCDYSRLFFPGVPAQRVVDGIFALEVDWMCDPAENPCVETALEIWQGLYAQYPSLKENWRFLMHLFRAECDAVIRRRRLFEMDLCAEALVEIERGDAAAAKKILSADFDAEYKALRAHLDTLARQLFELIGLQLDVEHYHADSWERGATLETIDQPVSDRAWLLNRLAYADSLDSAERKPFLNALANRGKTVAGEFYWSFALDGYELLGEAQQGEVYINFKGDMPHVNNGSIPMAMLKVFDNYTFRCHAAGLDDGVDYSLRVTVANKEIPLLKGFYIKVNGKEIFRGNQFGGERDEKFDRELLAPGFVTLSYTIAADVIENGCAEIEMGEPIAGVMLPELWIVKK